MRSLKKSIMLLLVLALTLCLLASCSGESAAMRYGDRVLSESDYAYMMAFIKGYYEYYYSYMASYYSYTISMDQLYDQEVGDGITFAEALSTSILEDAKRLLIVEQLCAEAGLTVSDSESLADISEALQELEDDYGGADALDIEMAKLGLKRSSWERYEQYNLLKSLLKEYRYGENGVARISEAEVRQAFTEGYVKAEGYLYSYLVTDSSGNRAMYAYDFASDYAEEDVEAYFLRTFLKISALRFEKEEAAESAYAALSDGSATFDEYKDNEDCEVTFEDAFVGQSDMSETLYEGLREAGEDSWYLSGEEDGYYYVVFCSPFTVSDLTEEVENDVRDAMLAEEAYSYFLDNYVTVRHILYSDEETAKQVYADLLAGTTTFAEHESETQDSGVQYTFTKGTMVDEFEEAAYQTEVGAYALVESEFGWHVLTRLELDLTGYEYSDVVAAMSRLLLQTAAQEQYEAICAGSASFEEPAEGALYSYSEPALLELSEQNEQLQEALKNAQEGEVIMVDLDAYGVFILRKHATTDEDLSSVYDEVESPLIENAFAAYLQTFFDAVVVNTSITDQFDVRTAQTFYY